MATASPFPVEPPAASPSAVHAKLNKGPGTIGSAIFLGALAIGFVYAAYHLISDLSAVHSPSIFPFVLLGVALLVALGFEFVNGFHDTANAVATVIYTHSLDPHIAVAWSGMWNFIGVVLSTGAVAFGIISLLPVELILQVGSGAGFAMVFALLTAAIIWNLGTWYFGIPNSSSHTLIGSIIGVGIANQLMQARTATSGVDWGQALNVGKSLLFSPIVGFILAASILSLSKFFIRDPRLYKAPEGDAPPPPWIRALLILTCTGVSFAHGSNDGQKGMGLIMLILIGTVPTAYALNHAITPAQSAEFVAISQQAANALDKYVSPGAVVGDPHDDVTAYVRTREFTPNTMLALRSLINGISTEVVNYKELRYIPQDQVRNFRNDMYLVSEALRLMQKSGQPAISAADTKVLASYKKQIDHATKFIPDLGEGCGGSGSGSGHDDRLEADRHHRGREDRQRPPDLRTGRRCRNYRDADHRSRRHVRLAGEHNPRAVVGRSGDHGSQRNRAAVGHRAQPDHGLGADAACRHRLVGNAVLGFRPDVVNQQTTSNKKGTPTWCALW